MTSPRSAGENRYSAAHLESVFVLVLGSYVGSDTGQAELWSMVSLTVLGCRPGLTSQSPKEIALQRSTGRIPSSVAGRVY